MVGATAVCVSAANAQLGLPDQIATAPALNAEQQESIGTFVKANAAGLSAPEASNIRRARSALIAPLRVPHASVEFRTRYADALDPVLKPLVSNARDEVVINALSIAGETGTRRAGVEILDLALATSAPPSV